MNIDVYLDEEGSRRLRDCLPTGVDIEAVAETIAKAGASEALWLATEQADVPSSLGDTRKLRVYCLIRAGLSMETLEPVVASTFKLTPRQARGLVDSALARYSARLADDVKAQVRKALEAALPGDRDDYIATIHSRYVETRLMEFLAAQPVEQPAKLSVGRRCRLTKKPFNAAAKYYDARERADDDKK